MLGRNWRLGMLAIGAAFLAAGTSRADDDTFRLGGSGSIDDAPAQNLIQRVDDATYEQTRVRAGFAVGGGRGVRVGVAGGYGYRGGYAYRGGFYGGYRGGYAYRGGFYGGYGYRGYRYGYGYGYPRYRYGFRVGFPYYVGFGYGGAYVPGYYGGYYGVNETLVYPSSTLTLDLQPMPQTMPNGNGGILPAPVPTEPKGPFRYDGGPVDPVPMPTKPENPKVQANDRFVSVPAAKKYTFGAYGEDTGLKTVPRDDNKTLLVKAPAK